MALSKVKKKILEIVSRPGRGEKVFNRSDFSQIGPKATVDRALRQLVDDGKVRKLGRGLYDFPRQSTLFNDNASVRINDIVEAIQRRDKVRMMPDGSVCANNLGLTNSVPARIIYLTDGSSRTLEVDGRSIRLKRVSSRWMSWHGRPGRDVVLALRWLGRNNIDDLVIKKIQMLPDDIKQDLLDGHDLMPRWMADLMRVALENEEMGDDGDAPRP